MRRVRHRVELLDVGRNNQAGDGPFGFGDPDGAVDQVADLGGVGGNLDVFMGDVFKEIGKINLLLVMRADGAARNLPHDRDDRLVIELGVVEAVQQMDRPGPEVARQTPTSPVNLACAQAMKADISSCRT